VPNPERFLATQNSQQDTLGDTVGPGHVAENSTRPDKAQAGAAGPHGGPAGTFSIRPAQQLRQACHVDGDAARLVLRQHLGLQRFSLIVA